MRLGVSGLGDEELARLARDGHRRAATRLTQRLYPRVVRIAAAIAGDADLGVEVARTAMTRALESGSGPVGASVVAEAQRLAVARRDADAPLATLSREERAAFVATEVEELEPARAASELGVNEIEIVAWREQAHQALGAPAAPDCAGWQLVTRYRALSDVERDSADRHLGICAACDAAWSAREKNRRRIRRDLPAQLASAGGGVGIGAFLASLGGSGVAATAAGTLAAGLLSLPHVGGPPHADVAGTRATAAVATVADAAAFVGTAADVFGSAVESLRTEDERAPDGGGQEAGDRDDAVETPRNELEDVADDVGAITDDVLGDAGDELDGVTDDVAEVIDEVVDGVEETCAALPVGDCPVDVPDGGTTDDLTDTVDKTVDETTNSVSDTTDDLTDTIDDTTDDLTDTIDDTTDGLEDVTDSVDETVDETTDTVDDSVGKVEDGVDGAVDDATDAIDDALGTVSDGAGDTIDGTTDVDDDSTDVPLP